MRAKLFCSAIIMLNSALAWSAPDLIIDTDYPGGNVIVESIEGDTLLLRTDLRDTEGWWFYWNFKVSGAAGRTVTFRFTERNPIGVRGPAVSIDNGATWTWLGTEQVEDASFKYTFPADRDEVQFAFSMPYLQSDLDVFLAEYATSTALVKETLCTSAKGRGVELLRAGCLDSAPKHRILLTARHHACESMASYALEGVLSAIVAEEEDGKWFRENVEAIAIPFMDKDGVEEGDQGKYRRPRDHNRDYIGESIHPEVAALRTKIPDEKIHLALDLHCPGIRGDHHEDIYIVGSPDAAMWEQQQAFGSLLEKINRGPLPYHASSNLPFGQSWNKASNYTAGKSFGRWAAELEGIYLSISMEIPYANAGGATVTPESARAFGHSLAKTIRAYLESVEKDY